MRQRLKKQGLEPDECFWLEHERAMRGKEKWRAGKDPPPDLAIEMDTPTARSTAWPSTRR